MTGSSTDMWAKVQPLVIGVRNEYGQPTLFQWFEYLAKRMEKRRPKAA